ncbi:MAG TPA: amidohydrolase family protein, partial [Puia sp.]|nr:amidohydrolase family protein [Puia sp.]
TNAVEKAGIPLPEALRMASTYPAAILGEQGTLGCIEPGACADLVLLDEQLNILEVMVDGEE